MGIVPMSKIVAWIPPLSLHSTITVVFAVVRVQKSAIANLLTFQNQLRDTPCYRIAWKLRVAKTHWNSLNMHVMKIAVVCFVLHHLGGNAAQG